MNSNFSHLWGHTRQGRKQTCFCTPLHASVLLRPLCSQSVCLYFLVIFHLLKKILQLKTTGLQLLVLITFHICAFHTTKPTALSKVNIVHFLYKILSPTLHNIILLQTKYSKNLFCPLYVIYVTQKQNLQTNHLPYYIDNKMCFYLVIFVYCSSHLYPE